jgi:hypothetical protein
MRRAQPHRQLYSGLGRLQVVRDLSGLPLQPFSRHAADRMAADAPRVLRSLAQPVSIHHIPLHRGVDGSIPKSGWWVSLVSGA